MTDTLTRRRALTTAIAALVMTLVVSVSAIAQQAESRFLAREDILLYGIGLRVEPVQQTVPRDIATIVSTFLQAPNDPNLNLPPFAPDAIVRATLRGPSFATPLELTTRPNTPFNIPPLTVAGPHTLENIRLMSGGDVVLRGSPESVRIDVIDRLLVTQVTARPLTAAEIRERGIVFDKSSFQAYNFTAAFAVQGGPVVNLNFPVVLPTLQGGADVQVSTTTIPSIQPPALQSLRSIIPDTLQIQTQVPNLSVVGFSLKVPELHGQQFIVPPIPGVIVFPGNIGFLNQFFSVLLMVSNAAPVGSNLSVSNLHASIVLPPGKDTVVGSADDPLAMARTAQGETPRVQPITQPGADGQLGTADDVTSIGPGETGNAEYLVEGRREGSHVVEMEIDGTLNGLPVGPVTIRGRAAGAVLVRNPTYTLTYIHPESVTAGEPYTLDVTVTNTSESPANFVSLNLFARNLSGATLVGDASKEIEFIAPGDSATVSFDLIARVSGKITAATLDSDEQVAGRFELKHSVGELGVPLSPDSLVLPAQAHSLPVNLRDATLGLLGKAWAVATAPAAALPLNVPRFSRQIVLDMAVATAEAGLRVDLHEPLRDSATQLAMDFFGSVFDRLPQKNPLPDDLAFARSNYIGFDDLRRHSARGDIFAQAVADLLSPDFQSLGVAAFHQDVAQKISYRPVHLSALIGTTGGPLPYTLTVSDAENRRVGGTDPSGKVIKEIPFADYLRLKNAAGQAAGQIAFLVAPPAGTYIVHLTPTPGAAAGTPFSVSLVVPTADGGLRHVVFDGLNGSLTPVVPFVAGDLYRVSIVIDGAAATIAAPSSDVVLSDPAPSIVGVVQQAAADQLVCEANELNGPEPGRVVAVLFSEEVTPESVQDRIRAEDITNFVPDANQVVSVALQPGGRVVFLALRDPLGPFVPRGIALSGIADLRGHVMAPQSMPMESTIPDAGGVVSGRVINADGTPVPFASLRLFNLLSCGENGAWVGISAKRADEQGRYSWDFVLRTLPDRIVAIDPQTEEFRDIRFNVQRNGQRLNVDIVMLGRGTFEGRTLSETGRVLSGTNIRITSLTDQSQYGAVTDANGRFLIPRIPVGNLLVEAVNTTENSRIFVSENIRAAGETTARDLVLLGVETTQVTVRQGAVRGHVLRNDGATPVAGVPVIVYYTSNSQPGALCPPPAGECAIAMVNADAQGAFAFTDLTAGQLRIETFDQASFQKGEVQTVLAAGAANELNIVLTGGLGTVHGIVLDPEGLGVAGARVGGGMSLTTTDATGQFTLIDVPVGRATVVAVSDTLGSRGTADVDILRPGEQVNATIVLQSVGGVGGVVHLADGTTPAVGIDVYLFMKVQGGINVAGQAQTDAQGRYSLSNIPLGDYVVSAFRADFSDGNLGRVSIKFNHQVAKADVTFRGGGGRVTGVVYDDDGVTPLQGRVSVSGDQLVIAGGRVGVAFQNVANFRIVDTDFSTGRFSLGGLWVGPFTLRAAGQFSPDPIALENTMPAAGATVQMDIRLQSTSQVSGRVFLPDGVTPAGANLIVRYKSDEFRIICSGSDGEESCTSIPQGIQEEIVVTDADGRFGVPLVNAGTFTLTVEEPATGRSGQIHGSVKAGERIDVSVRLVGLGAITVRVRAGDAVTPVPGARVVIQQLDFPNKTLTAFADDNGMLPIGGGDSFSEGAFVVTATDVRNGFTGRGSGRIEHDGDNIAVDVFLYTQTGVVYGTVYRSDGLTPVANAEVVVSGVGGPLAFTLTDASGAYRVEQIPLGAVSVDVFEAATARRGFANGLIQFDGLELPINVWELAMGVVRGTVLDQATQSPLRGWEVNLSQATQGGRPLPSLRTMSSVDGTFSIPGVSKGAVALSARIDGVNGVGNATGAIEREGQVVTIPLLARIVRPLFGGIQGRVFDPTGQPAANSPVDICAGTCANFSPVATLTASVDGTFSVGQLPLGRYEVRARAQGSQNVGSSQTEIAFDDEVTAVTVVLVGLSQITGQVVRSDNSPAGNVEVRLEGSPSSGCTGPCVRFADANGLFTFSDVPARSFTITAVDVVSGFKGVAGDSLNPGETRNVRVVLEPTGSVRGRVLRQNLNPAAGVTVDLAAAGRHLFQQTDAAGMFAYDTTPLGPYTISFEDSVGAGVASSVGTILGAVDLGDVRLDEAPPAVATVSPVALSTGVALNQVVTLIFSERVQAGTITTANITLNDDAGAVAGTLTLGGGDTTVTFRPLAPLRESTRYSVRVTGVTDLIGKVLHPDFVSSFTSVDLTPPAYLDISPVADTSGVPLYSPVRLKFSEPIDPTRTNGPPITLTGPGGSIDGRIDYLFGNTVAVFTPARPLDEDAVYHVHAAPAFDLAGNAQAQALDYTFGTTDRTPPSVTSLAAPATVIENGTAAVVASVGASHDVAFVDFFINDTFAATSRTVPFTLNLQAIAAFGHVGDQIRIGAIATDTSGNRGTVPATASITVLADQPPTVVITSPATGLTAANGARIVVNVRSTDDVGVQQSGFKAQTGRPQDGAIVTLASPSTDHLESFGFNVPLNAAPGSTILIEASSSDTAGHVGQAVPVSISVLDAVAPTVRITGASTGDAVRPGQPTTVIVSAQDLGGVGRVDFAATGIVAITDSRTIDPAPPSALASFTFVVPASARPGESITLQASATDRAGNVGTAASVILPVADTVAPTVQLRTSTGRLEMVPGGVLNLIADASDGISVARVELTGSGAFTVNDARPVTPPAGDAQVPFSILVPDTLAAGAVLNLQARAYDLAGNVSSPAFLSLSVSVLSGVSLPASTIVGAGDSVPVVVTLPTGAPAAGQLVTFTTADATVATVTPSVLFGVGETSRTIFVAGQSGGTTQLSARIQGVERAAMTVAVVGGHVDGVVFDTLLNPVAGAQVTISSGSGNPVAAVTGPDGSYSVFGVFGPGVTVRALDPVTALRGFAAASMNRANGFAHVNVVLVPAGSIQGTVHLADGVTPVAAGVRIDIYATGHFENLLGTTFTNAAGGYEFPLVAIGSYVIDASASDGHRGRSNTIVGSSADDVIANVTYLGRGAVIGTVFDANGQPVPNALLTFSTQSIFGGVEPIARAANPDGTFRFDNVLVGTFQLNGHDPVTSRAATASGAIASEGDVVTRDLHLAAFGSVTGTVRRFDGTTTVAGAQVSLSLGLQTTTDVDGRYEFPILPLGPLTITVSDPPTRGVGRATGTINTQGQLAVIDVQLLGQGTVIGTVTDAAGVPVAGATFNVSSLAAGFGDSQSGVTGADGTVQIERLLAGSMTVAASFGALHGSLPARELAANEVAHVTVTLEATARINGIAFAPDGQTPVTSGTATVLVFSSYWGLWVPYQSTPLGADGSFNFDGLPTSQTYQLQLFDAQQHLRAFIDDDIVLTADEVDTRNLTFVGIGTVRGRVVNPDGSSAPGYAVQVRSLNPDFGGYRSATSDAAGFYEAAYLAIGHVAVSTGNVGLGLLGEASGALAADGDVLTLDVLLQGNAVTFPVTFYDGNTATLNVQQGGEVVGGLGNVFYGADATGGSLLDVIAGGTETRFTGSDIGTLEDHQRELATRQQNIAGLNITRKVFVPGDGYFARYLELLSNPTANPITVDLRVTTHVGARNLVPTIISTSSGDTDLSVASATAPDRWVVIDDSDEDAYLLSSSGALSFAFDGLGAAQRAASATYTTTVPCPFYYCQSTGHLVYSWNQVVVPPGETVAYLHFIAQENNRPGALLAAQRLGQLAPEALAGLDAVEIAAIRNFAVPSNGVSTVAPLPPFASSVTGRVYEYDGTTPVSSAQVQWQSDNVLFHRPYFVYGDFNGLFTLTSNPEGSYDKVLLPEGGFTLFARHGQTGVISSTASGHFVGADAVADIVFSNTGLVTGHVRLGNGGVAPVGTQVVMTGGVFLYAYVGNDGSFQYTGVPPGPKSLIVSVPDPQGSGVQATVSFNSVAGQTVIADLQLPPTGAVSGDIRLATGAAAVSVQVSLRNASQTINRATFTDSSGHYTLSNLPIGVYTVSVTESRTGLVSAADVTVVANGVIAQDLTLVGLGTLRIQVNFANGLPAAATSVAIRRPVYSTSFTATGTTDANGLLVVANFPTTAFIIRAAHPLNSGALVDVSGTLASEGQVLPVTVMLPALGNIAGQVTYIGGAAAPSAPMRLYQGASTSVFLSTTADASGNYRFNNLALGQPYRVRALNPAATVQFKEAANVVLSASGDFAVNLTLPAQAAVRVTVRRNDGTLVTSGYVRVTDAFGTSQDYAIDANGIATAPIVAEGTFSVLPESITGQPAGVAVQGVVTAADHGQTINITVVAGIGLPTIFFDGNGYRFDISSDGSVVDGTADAYDGASSLAIFLNNSQQFFSGLPFATPEDNGREIAITRPNNQLMSGLSVTRKVYVPAEGYFARYLEVLTNPGTAPITVDVAVISSLGSDSATRVVATSSGDTFFTNGDTWLATDDDALDIQNRDPALAFVVTGPGAARAPSVEQLFSTDNINVRWNGVTVQPGQTVAFAHFLVQQPLKTGAIAAAQRLAQLPPEAMAGLSAEERAQIVNWAVPADGSSSLISIGTAAERTAVVTGRALAGDGVTPVRNASISYTNPGLPFLAAATRALSADANGQFSVTAAFAGDFTLRATDPLTAVQAPVVNGNVPAIDSVVTQDVVFSNTGLVRGRILSGGAGVSGASVSVDGFASPILLTASDGSYVFTGLVPGTYIVSATAGLLSGAATFNVAAAGQTASVDVAIGAATVIGQVTSVTGVPTAARVALYNPNGTEFRSFTTGGDGAYRFDLVPPGRIFDVRATAVWNGFSTLANPVVLPAITDGATLTANLRLMAVASARVRLVDVDGVTPIPFVEIQVDRQHGAFWESIDYTDQLGMLTVEGVLEPGFAVRALDNYGVIGSVAGTVAQSDDGATIDITLVAQTTAGQVQGSLFAADGATPINSESGTRVELIDESTGAVVSSDNGYQSYFVNGQLGTGPGYRVRAYSPIDDSVFVETTGQFAFRGQAVQHDFALPVAVISGVVRFADGTPLAYPDVRVRWTSGPNAGSTYYADRSMENGAYGLVVWEPGDFVLTAQDFQTGLTTSVTGSVVDLTAAVSIDVTFDPAGTLTGTFVDQSGVGVALASVAVSVAGSDVTRGTQTDANGAFRFDQLPAGPFHLQACTASYSDCASERGAAEPNITTVVNLALQTRGTVSGIVRQADGTPATSAVDVTVSQRDYSGSLTGNGFEQTVTSGAGGSYSFSQVPPGAVTVSARSNSLNLAGVATGTLNPGGAASLDVRLGSAVLLPVNLDDAAFRYGVACEGNVTAMGRIGLNDSMLYSGQSLDIRAGSASYTAPFPCLSFARLENAGRQVSLLAGYLDRAGIEVTRKVFVPVSGGFARYLEVLTNTSTVDVAVRVQVYGYLQSASAFSSGSQHIVLSSTDASRPALGLVFGGSTGAPAAVPAVNFTAPYFYSTEWLVTVPAGQTRRVMHFVAQAEAAGAVDTLAASLGSAPAAAALEGLTAAELASIVNFVIVPNP